MNYFKRIQIEEKFKDVYFGLEFIFQMFLNFGFGLFILYALIFELVNFKNDTIGLTNYGFAIMLGLSAICFSWASALTKKDKRSKRRILDNAIDALYGAIVFLMGAGFKYIVIAKDDSVLFHIYGDKLIIIYVLKALAFICFLVAVIKFYNVLIELLKIISLKKMEDWEDELKNKK